MWNIREGLGTYGPILESFPGNGNDAMALRTSVQFANAGTYNVFFHLGDTAAADPVQNIAEPNPIYFGIEGEDLRLLVAGDGSFLGTPGYNDYEILFGAVTVAAGETVNFIIDDSADVDEIEGVAPYRSVYLGLRIAKLAPEFTVSPGVFEWFVDPNGNRYRTWPQDEAAYPTQDDWLTITTRQSGSGMWNIREGLGTYGPILESFPNEGNDAMPLRTSVEFAGGGTYDVFFHLGDTAAADPLQNIEEPNPIYFGIEGEDLRLLVAGDGEFLGTPGYNDYEIPTGSVTVEAGQTVGFIIDDAADVEEIEGVAPQRSVYLGLRFKKQEITGIGHWSLY